MIAAVGSLRLLETQDQSGKFSLSGGIPVLWETFLEHLHPRAVEDVKNLGAWRGEPPGFSRDRAVALDLRRGPQGLALVALGKASLHSSC